MVSDAHEALRRLLELLPSRAAAVWLDGAHAQIRGKRRILKVRGVFPKRWLETRCTAELEEAFGGPVEVVAEAPAERPARRPRAVPRLRGAAGEFAVRMLRAFAEKRTTAARLIVLYGPRCSGKALLADWATSLGGRDVFRLDLERLRSGRSRGLVPRKPLVVAIGVEALAGRATAQRTFCTVLDAVQDRGGSVLVTVDGHPSEGKGLTPALRSRLLGGVLVLIDGEDPVADDSRAPPAPPLDRMKDLAARLFGVERVLIDAKTKRRSVVEARRTVMAAAFQEGLLEREIAAAFDLRSVRTVREACRWAARESERDRAYAALLHEVARVARKK